MNWPGSCRRTRDRARVQRHLFPKYPAQAAGLDFAVNCVPAQAVGGDYYNYWQGSHGGFHFALGDVSGKGIAAALLMASIQATLNGLGARATCRSNT
jgi:sigma-B regulation protein RsbU (phosphoserine phosphatase)